MRPFPDIFAELLEGQMLPPLTLALMFNFWILGLIPFIWSIVTIAFVATQHSTKKLVFHILASVLLGGLTFAMYVAAAFLPMITTIGSFGK